MGCHEWGVNDGGVVGTGCGGGQGWWCMLSVGGA